MIVVDASALVAILLREPDWEAYFEVLANSDETIISPINAWEVHVRAHALDGPGGNARVSALFANLGITVATVDARQFEIALTARIKFGRNILNLGDCFAYALATTHGGGALLYKGDDFARTDLRSALKQT